MTKIEYHRLLSALHEAVDIHNLDAEGGSVDLRYAEAVVDGINEALDIIETRVENGHISIQ